METLLAFVVGGLFAASIFMLLRKDLIRITIGLILLGNAVNLLIFTIGRLTRSRPPLIGPDAVAGEVGIANPLPQALILTAIVIGFGILAFTLALIYRSYKEMNTINVDELRLAEPLYPGEKIKMNEAAASAMGVAPSTGTEKLPQSGKEAGL